MALGTSSITLPNEVLGTVVGAIQDESVIAKLSTPIPSTFEDTTHLYFTPSAEGEVVAEGAAKSAYEQDITPVQGKLVKVQTTTRVSQELKWADDDHKMQIIENIINDQAKAIGRALDYVGIHAINPKSGAALSGYSHITGTGHVAVTAQTTAHESIDALISALNADYMVNGLALSPVFANSMRTERNSLAQRVFPDVPLTFRSAPLTASLPLLPPRSTASLPLPPRACSRCWATSTFSVGAWYATRLPRSLSSAILMVPAT